MVLDPFALPGARAGSTCRRRRSGRRRRAARRRGQHHRMLRTEHNLKTKQKIAIPVAIVFTKIDAFFPTLDRGNPLMATAPAVPAYDESGRPGRARAHAGPDHGVERAGHRHAHAAELLGLPLLRRLRARRRAGLREFHGRGRRGAAAPGRGPGPLADVQGRDGAVGMTAAAFDRLLYTDCAPGPAAARAAGSRCRRSHRRGLGAVEAGDRLAAVRGAEPVGGPAAPGRGVPARVRARPRRPATGRGRAATSGRRPPAAATGNHLADCLLTRDADLYGADPARPAVAVSRSGGPSRGRSTDCPDVRRADLEPGPLTRGRPRRLGARPRRSAGRCSPGCSACSRTRRASAW